jgi:hypothetical protein
MSSPPLELNFEKMTPSYNAFWEFSGLVAKNPAFGDQHRWHRLFRLGLRGMLARIIAVERHYALLQKFQLEHDWSSEKSSKDRAAVCEEHAGVMLFGMDSALECFVFALNALGFAKSPDDFRDIDDAKALRAIQPGDILGGSRDDQPRPGTSDSSRRSSRTGRTRRKSCFE